MVKTRNQQQPMSLNDLLDLNLKLGAQHDNLSAGTMKIYMRQLIKLYTSGVKKFNWDAQEFVDHIQNPRRFDDPEFEKVFKAKGSDIVKLIQSIYTSKESIILTLNAVCKMTKNRYRDSFNYYNAVRKEFSKQNKDEKLDNELTPQEEAKYISYDELMSIPEKVKTGIVKAYGRLFISKAELDAMNKSGKIAYLRSLFDYISLFLNIHHPIRLVWPSVLLAPTEDAENENYLDGNKLHVNNFKNVRLMGPQVLTLSNATMDLINQFIQFIKTTIDPHPTKLLWRVYNGSPGEFDYSGGDNAFSKILSNLFVKYNGKAMSMNMIRHITESHMIQSPDYAHLTNREKNDLHAQLLHSSQAANSSYNKIANRQKAVEEPPVPEPVSEPVPARRVTRQVVSHQEDHSFDGDQSSAVSEDTPATQSQPMTIVSTQRSTPSTGGKRRIFHTEFFQPNSNKQLEIDIFEK